MIVTTSHRALEHDIEAAYRFAAQIGSMYTSRENLSLQALQKKHKTTEIVVMEHGQPAVYQKDTKLFFHLGMSELRMLQLSRTGVDPLVEALGLLPGMSVLDCTLGLAADALIAAYAVGPAGRVLGLEAVPVIAAMTGWGLQKLVDGEMEARNQTVDAASRIHVLNADHRQMLQLLPTQSFDIVYFDPMFRQAKQASAGIRSLRDFADNQALTAESLNQALRVARLRVVFKEASGSKEFSRLKAARRGGGRYSSVQYGIIDVEGRT